MIAVPVFVGIYAAYRGQEQRFGRRARARRPGVVPADPGEVGNALLYSVGRTSGWFVEVALVWLVLSFPSGLLTTRVDRALVLALTAITAVLFLPTALLVERYPSPSPWSTCTASQPAQRLVPRRDGAGLRDRVRRPRAGVLAALVATLVMVRLTTRVPGASSLTRRLLGPVLPPSAGSPSW